MLTNCNYIGNVRYATKDEKRNFEVKGNHEPIISEELYNEAQELIGRISKKSYTKRPKEENYFSGILYCGKCGAGLVTHNDSSKNKNGEKVFKGGYRCVGYRRKTCNASNILHKNAERAFLNYLDQIEDFSAAHGRAPTVKEISKEFGVEESEVVFTLGSTRMPLSIYEQNDYKDEKSRELLDKLPAVDNQEEMVEKMQLKTALEKLPEREKKIIMLRYFRDMTQSEVAEVIGVSQVQISRIESKVFSEMKKMLG